ncbi:MAG: patatin-like phospholipase family protein [Candidatus Binatia bacterium]
MRLSETPPRIAIVLSGGGARGAYEAGVLYYVMEELPKLLGRPVRFQIVSGTSVGAIHACFLAGHAGESGAFAELLDIWRSFEIESTLRLTPFSMLAIPAKLLGLGRRTRPVESAEPLAPMRIPGLLDFSALERVILDHVPWSRIPEKIAAGEVESVAVAATEVKTGHTVIFIENGEGRIDHWARDPFVVAAATRLGPEHALASAAIPLIFSAIRIGTEFYCDGSLRLNTPLAPALRLGAERVLVIGLHYQRPPGEPPPAVPEAGVGSPAFLAGKVLNALLLDRIDYDADRLRLFNAILEQGRRAYGEGFLERINEPIIRQRGTAYRIVRDLFLRPSRDLGVIAAECLEHRRDIAKPRSWLPRIFLRLASRNTGRAADFLSYLYFDGCYSGHLIDLGIADAHAQREKLVEFFG